MMSANSSISSRVHGDCTRGNRPGDRLDWEPDVGVPASDRTSLVDSDILSIRLSGTKAGGDRYEMWTHGRCSLSELLATRLNGKEENGSGVWKKVNFQLYRREYNYFLIWTAQREALCRC